jgi:hypothetical protein
MASQSYATFNAFSNLREVEATQARDGASIWARFGHGSGFSISLSIEDAEKLLAALPAEIDRAKHIQAVFDAAKRPAA